jgi:TIR domain
LFLSYGVRDASEIAERLHRDLTARHYQIWQDIRRIRIGWPWDEEVQARLRNSQVLLAILSPQSVRRAREASNPTSTDSVCLDEIAYARGVLQDPHCAGASGALRVPALGGLCIKDHPLYGGPEESDCP